MAPDRSNDLHVELDGDGPPLLLLHGFTGGARTMWPLGRRLADVRHVAAAAISSSFIPFLLWNHSGWFVRKVKIWK